MNEYERLAVSARLT